LKAKTEESPLLAAVTREQLVKTQQAEKALAVAAMNCKLWTLVMALVIACT
jgi:hypothetical protein